MIKLYTILFTLLFAINVGYPQTIEAEKVHPLSKDAVKGELFHFDYNKEDQTYLLAFKRELKGKASAVCEFYKFDNNFNLISNETVKLEEAKNKYDEAFNEGYDPDEEQGWNDPKVLRVEPNLGGQIVLKKGYMTREWKTNWEEKGNYRYYYSYWKYDFHEEETIKPKFEGVISIPEDAPAFVKKMAENAGKKLTYVGHITDEPKVDITTGRRSYIYPSLTAKTSDYSSAIGDVLIIGKSDQINYDEGSMTKKPIYSTYVGLKYSAEDLSLKNSSTVFAGYSSTQLYTRALPDGSFMMICAPSPYTQKEGVDPNDYIYIRFSKDGDVIDNIHFNSNGGPWNVYGAFLGGDNDVYVWGGASMKKNGKFYMKAVGASPTGKVKTEDNFQIMKVKDNKIAYLTSTPIDEVNKKIVQPEGQKKAQPWEGEEFYPWADPLITADGTLIIPGNPADKSAFHYFQINSDGEFAAQYIMNFEQKPVEGTNIIHIFYQIPGSDKYTCIIMEVEKLENGKEYRYPKIATFDLKNKTVSAFTNVGYNKKEQYYLDAGYPMTYLEDGKKITFLSFDGKGKNVYLGRINLAQ